MITEPNSASAFIAPEQKSERYDRQLRLWGEDGQLRLERAHVAAIGAGAVSTEFLKNLVLPGVGRVTIVDCALVEERDLGSNFFFTAEQLGMPRSRAAAAHLAELNPLVATAAETRSPEWLVFHSVDFFSAFDLVADCGALSVAAQHRLEPHLRARGVPLLLLRANGFAAALRTCIPPGAVLETHPDPPLLDLRLHRPFPSLRAFLESYPLNLGSRRERETVPFPVLLHRATRACGGGGDGDGDAARADPARAAVRAKVLEMFGGDASAPNVAEALRATHLSSVCTPYEIPSSVSALARRRAELGAATCSTAAADGYFWLLLEAVEGFAAAEGAGTLPLSGALPDMSCSTQDYLRLVQIYADKAAADVDAVLERFESLLRQYFIAPPADALALVRRFCRNIAGAEAVGTPTLEDEQRPGSAAAEAAAEELRADPSSAAAWYFLLMAADIFAGSRSGRAPGGAGESLPGDTEDTASDEAEVRDVLAALLARHGLEPGLVAPDLVLELVRYGGSQLHTTAALLGGVAAQEACKLLTHQWVPLMHTWIYDGAYARAFLIES